MSNSEQTMTSNTLQETYGKVYSPKELGEFLGIDPRTVIKYHDYWGGVLVSPGKYRFFEGKIKEVLENAIHNNQTGKEEIPRIGNGKWKKDTEDFSGYHKRNVPISGNMGARDTQQNESNENRHGLLDDLELVE